MTSPHSRAFWPVRDLPAPLWLLAAVAASLLNPLVPAPRWLQLHLLLLGAVSHAILVWSRHFAEAVLHTASLPHDRRYQSSRLLLLNAGVVAVLTGVLGAWWAVTALGAAAVAAAVVWHGASLVQLLRRALPSRFSSAVRYYVAAACFLPVGAALGTVLARGDGGARHEQTMVAHAVVNVLGWVGLTVVGTLLTLWPTMLRTRLVDGAERATARALPLLVAATAGTATAALAGSRPATALGVLAYLGGLVVVARPLVATARRKPPSSYPAWSVLAGLAWLVCCLVAMVVGIGTAGSWDSAGDRFSAVTPLLAAGFGAQVLLGALSYLVPSVLGGGPSPVRAANAVMERAGALRIVLVNTGLLAWALPLPGAVRALSCALALTALASFLPLLLLAIRASRRTRRQAMEAS